MEKNAKVKTSILRQRIKQLEKALDKANVMIYSLNAMIDYAKKELKFRSEKSMAPNNNAYKRKANYKDGSRASL